MPDEIREAARQALAYIDFITRSDDGSQSSMQLWARGIVVATRLRRALESSDR